MDTRATLGVRERDYAIVFANAAEMFPERVSLEGPDGGALIMSDGERYANPYTDWPSWSEERQRRELLEGPLAASDDVLVSHGLVCPPAPLKNRRAS